MNTQEHWALFWCTLLEPLIFGEIERANHHQHLRRLSQQERRFPNGEVKKPSLSTLKRKWRLYQQGGYQALMRQPRADRGRPRKVTREVIASAVAIKRDLPTRSATVINQLLEAEHQVTLPRSTLYRHLKREGATRLKLGVIKQKVRCRWTRDQANELWIGDFSQGPYVLVDGRTEATYLSLFIDCHSRYVVEGRYYLRQSLDILIDSLLRAWTRYGLPNELYLDNAKVYHAKALKAACYALKVRLLHRTPGDPSPGGLVERLFRTNQDQFETEVRAGDPLTLAQLNRYFTAWLNVTYHQSVHSELKATPQACFAPRLTRPVTITEAVRFFMHTCQRVVHREFSDVSVDGQFFRVEPKYRGDRVMVRFDPFSAREEVLIYALDERFLCHAKRHQRERRDDAPPAPTPAPKPQYNYLDLIAEQHARQLDGDLQGIDFTQAADSRWPFPAFVHTLARLMGHQAGLASFTPEQLQTLKQVFDARPALAEHHLIDAVEHAPEKTLYHILAALPQES